MPTLAEAEQETAARVGPFYALEATAGQADAVTIAGLRSTAPLGGYEGLWLLRRGAARPEDRVRTVDRYDAPAGNLVVDFPYQDAPVAGEQVELHHLHPDWQLRADVLAALRRCYVTDVLDLATVDPPIPPSTEAGAPGGTHVDLTALAFWLTARRQLLAVARDGAAVPDAGRWGRPGVDGYGAYTIRGHLWLVVPAGVDPATVQVRCYRDAFGLVDGVDDPAGPQEDDDVLAVPVDYVAAFGHIEAWRRHRDRLEASAAEGRFSTQEQASTEASRVAALYADWLFAPQRERGDRIASPWGSSSGASGGTTSPSGLGGSGALAGAVVNIDPPWT